MKKQKITLGVIAIAFLFISSATLVPQAEGSIINEQIETVTLHNDIVNLLACLEDGSEATEEQTMLASYLLFTLIQKSIETSDQEAFSMEHMSQTLDSIKEKDITSNDITEKSISCLQTIKTAIEEKITPNTPLPQNMFLDLLRELITMIIARLTEGGSTTINGTMPTLLEILQMILSVPIMIIRILAQGITSLFQIVFNIIKAIISMIVLIISGIQLALLVGGIFFLFIGVASSLGIKILSFISAPLFAIIAILFTISVGTLISNTAFLINILIGIVITFAIPIGLIAAIIYFLTADGSGFDFEGFTLGEDGLLYMLGSIFSSIFNTSD